MQRTLQRLNSQRYDRQMTARNRWSYHHAKSKTLKENMYEANLKYIRFFEAVNSILTEYVGFSRIRSHCGCPGIILNTGHIPWLNILTCLLRLMMLNLT